jgi:hypothetical protein
MGLDERQIAMHSLSAITPHKSASIWLLLYKYTVEICWGVWASCLHWDSSLVTWMIRLDVKADGDTPLKDYSNSYI